MPNMRQAPRRIGLRKPSHRRGEAHHVASLVARGEIRPGAGTVAAHPHPQAIAGFTSEAAGVPLGAHRTAARQQARQHLRQARESRAVDGGEVRPGRRAGDALNRLNLPRRDRRPSALKVDVQQEGASLRGEVRAREGRVQNVTGRHLRPPFHEAPPGPRRL
jgi:hypothetical protein